VYCRENARTHHRRTRFLQDNIKMNLNAVSPRFPTTSTALSRTASVVLLAGLVALITHTVLNVVYSDTAPATDVSPSVATFTPPSPPAWLLTTASAVSVSPFNLVGVVVEGSSGYALLQQGEQRAKLLRVGQSLPDGTQLLAVHQKSATLIQQGVQSTLTLSAANNSGNNSGGPTANSAMGAINPVTGLPSNLPAMPAIAPVSDAAIQASINAAMQNQQMQQTQQAQMAQQVAQEQAMAQAAIQSVTPTPPAVPATLQPQMRQNPMMHIN
jgi:hypothetical protein